MELIGRSLFATLMTFAVPTTPEGWGGRPDPTCAAGIPNEAEGVCCAASCKICGGHGCGGHPGGADACCGSAIRKDARPCTSSAPPCTLAPGAKCTLSPGVEYLGNNTVVAPVSRVSTAGACCEACTAAAACAFFTYEAATGLCTLRNNNAPDTSRENKGCTSGFVAPPAGPAPVPPEAVAVRISAAKAVSRTAASYVNWNIDASRNRGYFDRDLNVSRPLGAKLARLARAISDAAPQRYSVLRFGGSGNDYLTYGGRYTGVPCPPQGPTKECMNETTWTNLLDFTRAANAKIVFGLSMNTGHDDLDPFPQPWDPTNAEQILNWTIERGYSDLIYGFELGNEQNSKYTAEKIATDFQVMQRLTERLWPAAATRPLLIGPDPHSYHSATDGAAEWLGEFVSAAKRLGVPLHAATHHEYVEVDATSFQSPSVLDNTGAIARMVNRTVREANPAVAVWGGEIGPHNGGSPPCDHTSMRWANYGDSLWFSDALAAAARNGYGAFCRQDLIGADYGLLDCSTGSPLPDYYTALLFAKLMGRTVLSASVSTARATAVRVYAHCGHVSGTIALLLINLSSRGGTTVTPKLESGQPLLGPRHEFRLEPSNHSSPLLNATGLLGTGALLNGKLLVDGEADISGRPAAGPISLPAMSILFAVTSSPEAEACR